ncbi:MAG: LysR substrate-binding domain-containing protein [Sandaracinaceae bacterium]
MIPHGHQAPYELRHLHVFLAVARHLSFRRAAEELHLAQPAVSKAIKQLEEALGARLFDRDSRRVLLTRAGCHLVETLPDALQQVTSSLDETRAVAHGRRELVRVGYATAAMTSYLPPVLADWDERLDGLRVELREGTSDDLLVRLRSGHLDACFVVHEVDDPALCSRQVGAERLGVVLWADHRLTRRRRVRLEDLADETIICFARHLNPDLYDEVIAGCRRAGFSPRLAHPGAARTVAVGLAAAGQGVALLSEGLRHMCRPSTEFRPLSPALCTEYHLVVRAGVVGDWLDTLTQAASRG